MRILQLISSGGYYGAESMVVNLSKALTADGHKSIVGVFCNLHNPHVEITDRARQYGLTSELIPCRGRIDASAVRAICKLIGSHEIDLVHAHGSKANLYALFSAAKVRRPLVATTHIDWPDRSIRLRCYHLADRLVLRGFSKVVAVSDRIERSLAHAGLRRSALITIDNGIDLDPFTREPAMGCNAHREDRELVIGVVGRLTPQKGHRYLLLAAGRILAAFPNVSFLFIGEGPESSRLQAMVASLGLVGKVTFGGFRSDMPTVYRSMDVVILPSVNEGMPMTLIEAMAAARPVIATDVGDVPKLVRDGETGVLVRPADPDALGNAILTMLSDPERRRVLGMQAQSFVTGQFSATRMARRYADVYHEALEWRTVSHEHACSNR